MKFDFYCDPGHGWLKVRKSLLVRLGIADAITPYSYVRGDWAYLEEDCDYTTFARRLEADGKKVEPVVHSTDRSSRIRSYKSYPKG